MKKGFTLVELVMAALIGGIALSALLSVFINTTIKSVELHSLGIGVHLANGKLEEISSQSFGTITSEALTAFGGDYNEYSYQVVVNYVSAEALDTAAISSTDYKKITVRVTSVNYASSIEVSTLVSDASNE